jgi:hypothetical protein
MDLSKHLTPLNFNFVIVTLGKLIPTLPFSWLRFRCGFNQQQRCQALEECRVVLSHWCQMVPQETFVVLKSTRLILALPSWCQAKALQIVVLVPESQS